MDHVGSGKAWDLSREKAAGCSSFPPLGKWLTVMTAG